MVYVYLFWLGIFTINLGTGKLVSSIWSQSNSVPLLFIFQQLCILFWINAAGYFTFIPWIFSYYSFVNKQILLSGTFFSSLLFLYFNIILNMCSTIHVDMYGLHEFFVFFHLPLCANFKKITRKAMGFNVKNA